MSRRGKDVPKVGKEQFKKAGAVSTSSAPALADVVKCHLLAERPINRVLPMVTVTDSPGFFHQDIRHPAAVVLSIVEQDGAPPFQGTGSVSVVGDNAKLFTGPERLTLMNMPLSADALRAGVPCYVVGDQAGPVTVRLSLASPPHPRIVVVALAAGAVTIEPINVITAVIEGDPLALMHDGLVNAFATSLSDISVSFHQTNPARCCDDLAFNVTYDTSVTCFRAGGLNTAFLSGSTVLRSVAGPSLALLVWGHAQRICVFRARAVGTEGPGWMFADESQHPLWVERLIMDAFKFRDGDLFAGAQHEMADGGPPRERQLHQSNENIFTFARCRMQAPSPEFWNRASAVTLAADEGSTLFVQGPPLANIGSLDQVAFAQGAVEFSVRTAQAEPIAVQQPPNVHFAELQHYPPVPDRPSHVSCGATIHPSGKQLVFGDIVNMQTFSFDHRLDRMVRVDAVRIIKLNQGLKVKVALARAQAHRLYGKSSVFYTNKNMGNQDTAFKQFVDALRLGLDPRADENDDRTEFCRINPQKMALCGRQHIVTVILPTVLAPGMETRIENYFVTVITSFRANLGNANKPNFGFNVNYGIPGAHAECLAVNQLMREGIAGSAITVATYKLATYKLGIGDMKGKRFVACANCKGILLQNFPNGPVRVITDNG